MTDDSDQEYARADLVDALRDEILADGSSDDSEDFLVPDGVLALFRESDLSAEVGEALDDLLVEEDTITGSLHNRLVARVAHELAQRQATPRFVEELLRTGREEKGLTASDLAVRLETTAEAVSAIESAQSSIGDLTEVEIAAWVDEVDLELDLAMTTLERSLMQPASSYRGEHPLKSKQSVKKFVSEVRRLVEERRSERSSG